MKDFKKIKNKICYRLVNYEANKEVLLEYAHVKVLDLAILFYYKQEEGLKEGAIRIISARDCQKWDVSVEELYKVAKENSVELLPSIFQTIEQVIGDIANEENLSFTCDEEPRERMYVLTNEEKYFGAGCFLYPQMLENIAKRLKGEFFILPSSIHECIIMPDVGSVTASNLKSLVAEMNEQFLEPGEMLSNCVYHYDCEKSELALV